MATVDIHYIAAALRCAERQGLNSAALLNAIGVAPEQLQQPFSRVDGAQMTQLVQLVWRGLGDEFMGCTPRRCKPGVFALMARHALHYERLETILQQGLHFYNLFTDDIQMRLVRRGKQVELEAVFSQPELDPDGFYREFWLVIWHRFSSWVIGQKITLSQVCFTDPRPEHQRELKYLFPCRHSFSRPTLKLCFSADYLALPCVRTQHELNSFLRHSPADLITIPGDDKSYARRIRSLLLRPQGEVLRCPDFEQLAAGFNLSAQTLRRRLRDEGTSYPEIKAEIRRDLAIEKLCAHKLGVSEVARQLNFSEPRAFSRAFKQWTGLTPKCYLEQYLPVVEP